MEQVAPVKSARTRVFVVGAAGLSIVAYGAALGWMSHALAAERMEAPQARLALMAVSMLVGAVYLAALFPRQRVARGESLWWIFTVAFAARVFICSAPPMLEDDYYRYLWDGAVSAHGFDPYRYTPQQALGTDLAVSVPEALRALAGRHRVTVEKINHPHLTTVYPLLAQAGFLLAHWLSPFQIWGWRALLSVCDRVAVLFLALSLRAMGRPLAQLAWYAWNPVLLREVYSAAHMEALLLPLLALAVLLALRARPSWSAVWLTAASAVKVWPALLVGLALRPLLCRRGRLLATVVVCALVGLLLWLPMTSSLGGERSGMLTYSNSWQNNDGFFRLGEHLFARILPFFGFPAWQAQITMRWLTILLVVLITAWQSLLPQRSASDFPRRCLVIVAAIFLLSPTQFPWYWLWLLPFLTLIPVPALLLYAVLLPIYLMQHVTPWMHWIEHGPVWLFLGLQGLAAIRRRWKRECFRSAFTLIGGERAR